MFEADDEEPRSMQSSAETLGRAASLAAAYSFAPEWYNTLMVSVEEAHRAAMAVAQSLALGLEPVFDLIEEFAEEWFAQEMVYPRPKPPANLFAPRHIPPKGIDRQYYTGKVPSYLKRTGQMRGAYHYGTRRKGYRHGK